MSYRASAETVTRCLHLTKEESCKTMTLRDRIETIGQHIRKTIQTKADQVLSDYNIDLTTTAIAKDVALPSDVVNPELPAPLSEERIAQEAEAFNAKREEDCQIKDPLRMKNIEASSEGCVYVSIDDIGVRHQKESRAKEFIKKQVYVENTVIHIQEGARTHILTAIGMNNAMRQLLAFLLYNRLLENHRLIFFTDGATIIKEYIEKYFSFREYTIILDWFHLRKRCNEILSMGIKGSKDSKAEIKRSIMKILWSGNVSHAKDYVSGIKKKNIKNQEKLDELIVYLDRKNPYIACYALRCRLRLINSSNRVERSNQLVVGRRQKHHGMSWSFEGSGALAAIATAERNNELYYYIHHREIPFRMAI